LFLHKEEFSDLVEAINKSAYGILGKKELLMGKPTKNDG
jgi:Txe/YoeB family toxin of Txe-Axe toxin-antitoxin module